MCHGQKHTQGNRLKDGMLILVLGFEGLCPWLLVCCFGSVLNVMGGGGVMAGTRDSGCLPHASEKQRMVQKAPGASIGPSRGHFQ